MREDFVLRCTFITPHDVLVEEKSATGEVFPMHFKTRPYKEHIMFFVIGYEVMILCQESSAPKVGSANYSTCNGKKHVLR